MRSTKIFIGSSSNGEDAEIEEILEYSLRKNYHHTDPLEFVWMRQTNKPWSYWHGFKTSKWSTPFSGFRWAIPEFCGFQGRAIYMDVDQINFRNIRDLYDISLYGRPFAARRGPRFGGHEFCVMVIDCEAAREYLIPVQRQRELEDYHLRCISSFSGNEQVVLDIDPRWNCLDGEDRKIDDIWHLHWTKMSTQPWKPAWFTGIPEEHPRQDLVQIYKDLHQELFVNQRRPMRSGENPPVQYNIIGR
jgi:hypothetical protein